MVSQLYYRIVSKACLFHKSSFSSCTSVAEKMRRVETFLVFLPSIMVNNANKALLGLIDSIVRYF